MKSIVDVNEGQNGRGDIHAEALRSNPSFANVMSMAGIIGSFGLARTV